MNDTVLRQEDPYSHHFSPSKWQAFRGILAALEGRPAQSAAH